MIAKIKHLLWRICNHQAYIYTQKALAYPIRNSYELDLWNKANWWRQKAKRWKTYR